MQKAVKREASLEELLVSSTSSTGAKLSSLSSREGKSKSEKGQRGSASRPGCKNETQGAQKQKGHLHVLIPPYYKSGAGAAAILPPSPIITGPHSCLLVWDKPGTSASMAEERGIGGRRDAAEEGGRRPLDYPCWSAKGKRSSLLSAVVHYATGRPPLSTLKT